MILKHETRCLGFNRIVCTGDEKKGKDFLFSKKYQLLAWTNIDFEVRGREGGIRKLFFYPPGKSDSDLKIIGGSLNLILEGWRKGRKMAFDVGRCQAGTSCEIRRGKCVA